MGSESCSVHDFGIIGLPYGHWQISTFIAALRWDRIDAPFLIEGSANMEVLAACVGKGRERALPTRLQPGSQSDRAGFCQAQGPPAPDRRPYPRVSPSCGRSRSRLVPSRSLSGLLSPRPIRDYLTRK